MSVAEADLDAERCVDVGPAGRFACLVPGEGAHQCGGLAGQGGGDRVGDLGRSVAVRQRHDQGVAADPLDEGRGGGLVGCLDDQVSLPAARLGPARCGGGSAAQGPIIAQRAGCAGAAAAGGMGQRCWRGRLFHASGPKAQPPYAAR